MSTMAAFEALVRQVLEFTDTKELDDVVLRHVCLRELEAFCKRLRDKDREHFETVLAEEPKRKFPAATVAKNEIVSKRPDEKQLRAYLIEKGVEPSQVFVSRRSEVFAPDRLQDLLDTGHIEAERVGALHTTKTQLRVTSNRSVLKGLKALMEQCTHAHEHGED